MTGRSDLTQYITRARRQPVSPLQNTPECLGHAALHGCSKAGFNGLEQPSLHAREGAHSMKLLQRALKSVGAATGIILPDSDGGDFSWHRPACLGRVCLVKVVC